MTLPRLNASVSRILMIALTTIVLLATGCSSTYVMVETWNSGTGDRTFYHECNEGPNVGLVVRQLARGQVQVGVEIVNDGELPLTVPMDLKAYVDGVFLHGQKGEAPIILASGGRKRIMCQPIFRPYVTLPVVNTIDEGEASPPIRVYKGKQVVHITLGPYRTADVILDLSPENNVPARFAESP